MRVTIYEADCKFNDYCNNNCKNTGDCKLFVIRTDEKRKGSSGEKIEQ